jgi:methionyl aminopeptidase
MIYLKTEEEIDYLRESSQIVAKALAEVAKHIQPGVTTKYLDQVGEQWEIEHIEDAFRAPMQTY